MERLIFREEQSFRQSYLPWVLLGTLLMFLAGFGIGFYQQLYLGKPYGDEPMSNSGMLWSGIVSFIALSALFIFILSGHLLTEIWSDGIRYNFPPFIRKIKHRPLSEISSVEVAKYRPVAEFGGWGWRRRFLSKKTAFNISGRIGIRVILKNGRQIMFGTQKQEEMKRAVDKMIMKNT